MELSINRFIKVLIKHFALIALLTTAGLIGTYMINSYLVRPTYTASVQLYVNPNETASASDINELNYAQKIVNTYISFLNTKVFYSRVLDEVKLNFSLNQIKNMTRIKAVNNTEIFEISVNAYSPEVSCRLAGAMQEIAPALIKEIKSDAEISIVDPVVLPTEPSGPNIPIRSAAGGVVGFITSITASILIEMFDIKIKNEEGLREQFSLPIIGAIPDFDFRSKHKKARERIFFFRRDKRRKRTDRIINKDTDFAITEAYKSIRTNLRYILSGEGCRSLLINSPSTMEGKSTTCMNIGITIAQAGARVLLMDCDLRMGRLHKAFRLKNSPGMSEVLSGMISEKEVIQNTVHPNLKVITLGTIPPNPTELLASNLEELLTSLKKSFDYILIDSPPVNAISDALSIGKLVDGILLVVKENSSTIPNIAEAIAKYQLIGAQILGFILNEVTLIQGNKAKSKYYYYDKNKND